MASFLSTSARLNREMETAKWAMVEMTNSLINATRVTMGEKKLIVYTYIDHVDGSEERRDMS